LPAMSDADLAAQVTQADAVEGAVLDLGRGIA
jgi:hypothetical protein